MNLTNINVKARSLPVNNEYNPDVMTSKEWGRALPRNSTLHLRPGAVFNTLRVLVGFQTNVGKEDSQECLT